MKDTVWQNGWNGWKNGRICIIEIKSIINYIPRSTAQGLNGALKLNWIKKIEEEMMTILHNSLQCFRKGKTALNSL